MPFFGTIKSKIKSRSLSLFWCVKTLPILSFRLFKNLSILSFRLFKNLIINIYLKITKLAPLEKGRPETTEVVPLAGRSLNGGTKIKNLLLFLFHFLKDSPIFFFRLFKNLFQFLFRFISKIKKLKIKNLFSFLFHFFKNLPQLLFRVYLKITKLKIKNYFLIIKYLFRHPRKFYNALSKQSQKLTKRLAIVSLIVLVSIPASFWYGSKDVQAAWWNDSWLYRKSIAITNNTTAQNNVFISVTIDTSDTTKFQTDCGDLRFTNFGGDLLPYYIVSGCSTASTTIHTFFDTFPTGAQTIYYYYGNLSAGDGFSSTDFSTLASNYTVGSLGSEEKGTGPVAYWAFDEGQGVIANDSVIQGGVVATGGNTVQDIGGYRIHTYTSSGTFTVTTPGNVEVLVVAGGGGSGGGGASGYHGGGGGGGGVVFHPNYTVAASISITVGSGGLAGTQVVDEGYQGGNGGNSVFGSLTANGGGGGGGNSQAGGVVGGSGGGGNLYCASGGLSNQPLFTGATVYGNAGGSGQCTFGSGGGGGGAGTAGGTGAANVGGSGGQGISNSISSVAVYYGGGGAAVGNSSNGTAINGACAANTNGTNGIGQGAGGVQSTAGWTGGSGIVIIRYPIRSNNSYGGDNGILTNMASPATSTSGWQSEDQCVSGKCLAFDGTNDLVSSSLNYNSGKVFTLSAYIKPLSTGGGFKGIVGTVIGNNLDSGLTLENNKICYHNYTGSADYDLCSSNDPIQLNQWQHVALTYDNGSIKIYHNGVNVGSGTFNKTDTSAGVIIGGNFSLESDRMFNGQIDEPKIYDYARSAAQIKLDYNAGIAGTGGAEGVAVSMGSKSAKWLTDGLVGHWKMDESSGNLTDSSGNSNTGTVTGTTVAAGKYGNGRSFDGISDFAQLTNKYTFSNNSFTIGYWLYLRSDGSRGGFFQRNSNSPFNGISLGKGGADNIACDLFDTSGNHMSSEVAQELNQWVRYDCTYDPIKKTVILYKNGIQVATNTNSSFTNVLDESSQYVAQFAKRDTSSFMDASMDEVRVYNRALFPKEVSDLYSYAPGPVAYWNMEEGSGTTANDTSGNGNNLTLFDSPSWLPGKYGNGIKLTSGSDYLNSSFKPVTSTNNNFTVSSWMYFNSFSNYAYILSSDAGSSYQGFSISSYATTNNFRFWVRTTSGREYVATQLTSYAIPTKEWIYVTMSFDENQGIKFYVDGTLQTTITSYSSVSYPGELGFELGRPYGNSSYQFDGNLDEVKIYNYARTTDQIMEDMQARGTSADGQAASVSASGKTAAAYYKFDEGYGTTAHDSVTSKGYVADATGGTITDVGGYRIHTFTADGTFTPTTAGNVEVLVVAGGGTAANDVAGGGGGGGVLYSDVYAVTASAYPVTVGSGGATIGANGANSVFGTLTAIGGGGGGSYSAGAGATGGSGGGGSQSGASGSGTIGQGFAGGSGTGTIGYSAAGGGGAGGIGGNGTDFGGFGKGGDGGPGLDFSISGLSVGYGGGGGGGGGGDAVDSGAAGTATHGGGAGSARWLALPGNNGTPGTGGGGGGTGRFNGAGQGGSGIVIIRYPIGANDGALTNMASPATATSGWTSTGKFGKALNFDGTNDYVNAGNVSSLNFERTDSFSVSVWAKTNDNVSGRTIVGKGGYISGGWGIQNIDTSQIRFFLTNSGTNRIIADMTPPSSYYAGAWTHIVFTYNGSSSESGVVSYINGQNISSELVDNSLSATTQTSASFYIGTGFTYFNGFLDEVKIYPFALTADEVALEYNHGSSIVMGSKGTDSSGNPSNSSDRAYCVPGDASACSAPVAEWNFEEGGGTTANDTSGNNNTGTLTNGPTYTAGKIGKAINFDGTNDYISLSRFGFTSEITLESWVKTTSADSAVDYAGNAAQNILGDTTSSVAIGFGIHGGKVRYNYYNGGWPGVTGNVSVNDGIWHHIVATHNRISGAIVLYVDGKVDTTGSITSASGGGIDAIGRGYAGDYFTGAIDGVKIYNYARTPAQVAYDYNRGGPVGWWKMDECQGSAIHDSSGNANNGTLTVGASGTQTAVGTCTTSSTAWGNGATGKINSSLNFDGTDDYIDAGNGSTLKPKNFTIDMWFKSNDLSGPWYYHYLIGNGQDYNNAHGFGLSTGGNSVGFWVGDGTAAAINAQNVIFATIQTGEWYHVIATYQEGVGSKLYLNGILKSSDNTFTGSIVYDSNSLNIGKLYSSFYYFNGQIDDVRVYNYALTAQQVKDVYNNGAVSFK